MYSLIWFSLCTDMFSSLCSFLGISSVIFGTIDQHHHILLGSWLWVLVDITKSPGGSWLPVGFSETAAEPQVPKLCILLRFSFPPNWEAPRDTDKKSPEWGGVSFLTLETKSYPTFQLVGWEIFKTYPDLPLANAGLIEMLQCVPSLGKSELLKAAHPEVEVAVPCFLLNCTDKSGVFSLAHILLSAVRFPGSDIFLLRVQHSFKHFLFVSHRDPPQ